MIVPAPMKPMPLTTCAAIRLGSSRSPSCVARKPSNPYCDTIIIRALPSATRKWVRNPASLTRYSRSSPITVPQRPATHNLNIKSHSISIVPRFYSLSNIVQIIGTGKPDAGVRICRNGRTERQADTEKPSARSGHPSRRKTFSGEKEENFPSQGCRVPKFSYLCRLCLTN